MVLLLAQVRTAGVVSTTATVWLQMLLRPQALVTSQVRVMNCGQTPLVAVLRMAGVRLAPVHGSTATGESKNQEEPHSTGFVVPQTRGDDWHLPTGPSALVSATCV